jgi:hypothetical protein
MARRKIGALWRKQGAQGEFFSGVIELLGEDIPVMVFPTKKAGETAATAKQPDYEILRAREDSDAKAAE